MRSSSRKCEGAKRNRARIIHENKKNAASWLTVSACETGKWILDVAYVHDKTVTFMRFICFLFQANTFFNAISESLTRMKSSVMNLRQSLENMKINNSGLYRSG